MKAAQKAIVATKYDKAISRSVLARSRAKATDPLAATWHIGDAAFYWRTDGKKGAKNRERWFGPAAVVGVQGNTLWLFGGLFEAAKDARLHLCRCN